MNDVMIKEGKKGRSVNFKFMQHSTVIKNVVFKSPCPIIRKTAYFFKIGTRYGNNPS